jgi:hypothetical protein
MTFRSNELNYINSSISHLKQKLVCKNNVILVGYSLQSLKNNEYLFEVYDIKTNFLTNSGTINIFGVKFLTPYIPYKDHTFINLISISGKKII